MDLDEMLETVQVLQLDEDHVLPAHLNLPKHMIGWYAVTDESRGAFAYFASETEACFYRLALINARMNNIKQESEKHG